MLGARIYLRSSENGGVLETMSYLSQSFTILTNAMVFVGMLFLTLERSVPAQWLKPTVIAILIVGIRVTWPMIYCIYILIRANFIGF